MIRTPQARNGPIFVCCPHARTGGPECLHTLVHELRAAGNEAYIVYYPFDKDFTASKAYAVYDAPQEQLKDDHDSLVIIPEVATWIVRSIRKAKVAIYWLSVDNYFDRRHDSGLLDWMRRYRSLLRTRVPLLRLKRHQHFAQSVYAFSFLRRHKIDAKLLTDYLNPRYLQARSLPAPWERENIIVYNPLKGFEHTQKLIAAMPQQRFVALQGLTSEGVSDLLRSAKLYIDFGHHPGKDRAPREAAINGCAVVVGLRGSAVFDDDVPIPSRYKLSPESKAFTRSFTELCQDIFLRPEFHWDQFASYRSLIKAEPDKMRRQLRDIVEHSEK